MKPRLRREDIFARTGGEEFGILLPEIGLDGRAVTAEKVRRIVEATPLKHDQQIVPCHRQPRASPLLGEGDATPEDLYKRADERLYEAKQAGRNRVSG